MATPFLAGAAPPGTTSALLVGGSDPAAAAAALTARGATVIVGTPGRTADALARAGGALDFKRFDLLILDEADRLLESSTFRAQVDAVVARLPKQRRTGLFSATQTDAVTSLARAGLRNAVRVRVGVAAEAGTSQASRRVTPASLRVEAAVLPVATKVGALATFLVDHAAERVIAYFATCAAVDFYAAALPAPAAALAHKRHSKPARISDHKSQPRPRTRPGLGLSWEWRSG